MGLVGAQPRASHTRRSTHSALLVSTPAQRPALWRSGVWSRASAHHSLPATPQRAPPGLGAALGE